ncbi:hypothetical protein B0H12DRAFT_10477 [Mycena haematopus]|nr:hypothetical protein B0H12DRAFT_10477 [Mycena haematopus]
MPEDAQPNDLRGRNLAPRVPLIRPARGFLSPSFSTTARASFKRPSGRSHPAASPKKKRKLDQDRKEVICELPPACQKGQIGCNSKRKKFVVDETERLRRLGLKVFAHTIQDDAVHFSCTQEDILNCFLAPIRTIQQERSQSQVGRFSNLLPPPNPIISTVPGPPRLFKSGTLSFSAELPVVAETPEERVNRPSGTFDTDLDHSMPVAELMFGKQGPPKQSSISAARASVPTMKHASVSNPGTRAARPVPLQPGPHATASSPSLPTVTAMKPSLPSQPTSSATALLIPPPYIPSPSTPEVRIADKLSLEDSTSATTLYIPPLSHDPELSLSDDCYTCEPDGDEFRIPFRTPQDKLRRFLCGTSSSASIIVSMHGTLEGVDVFSHTGSSQLDLFLSKKRSMMLVL